MAPVLRQGWELNDPNVSSRQYRATLPATAVDSSGRTSSSRIVVINNLSTGAFDYYEPGSTGFGSPFARYDPIQNKVIPLNQPTHDKYFSQNTPTGRSQLTSITNNVKGATFDLAQINTGTDPLNNREFEDLKKKSGYQSLANKAKGGQRASPPGSAVPNPSVTPTDSQGSAPLEQSQIDEFKKERESIEKNQRQEYDDVIYPEGLNLTYQDCIKFSIVKYQQSGLKGFGPGNQDLRRVSVNSRGRPEFKNQERKILGTIVLPIPGGINDSNRVNWSGMDLPDLQGALAGLMKTGIMGGDMSKDFVKQAEDISAPGSGARTAIVSKLIESAIGQGGIMQREFGAIINPNLELLFNSPDLRQFSFSFKLSPRSKTEAEIVRKIIRNFKQAMSVKRSTSSFLLQTPHTFAISYIFKNKDHPYLNKFKECALTNCNVNYTPEATYMSFEDGAMVSYQLDLTFQELEPIYDDDYGSGYTNIGY
jgi:hypothetical protein